MKYSGKGDISSEDKFLSIKANNFLSAIKQLSIGSNNFEYYAAECCIGNSNACVNVNEAIISSIASFLSMVFNPSVHSSIWSPVETSET